MAQSVAREPDRRGAAALGRSSYQLTDTVGSIMDGSMRSKFWLEDEAYLSERADLSEKMGTQELWSVIDHWPLYCGVVNLGRYMAIADLLRTTLDVPGHIAEFGTWRGANLMLLAKLMRIFDPNGSKQIHAFDSFEGLTDFASEDAGAVRQRGQYRGSLAELEEMIALYRLSDEVIIHEGRIEETLPRVLEANRALTFSFLYCDVDLFEPTKLILSSLHDRLSKGGLFVLDEWNSDTYPGETVAVREFLSSHGDSYDMQHVKNARQPTLVLRKITT